MANYHKRNSIRAVQWAPENAQSFEDIKKLIAENPGIGWKADNIVRNDASDNIIIRSFGMIVLRIKPYEYLVEGKKDSLFTVSPETFELMYTKTSVPFTESRTLTSRFRSATTITRFDFCWVSCTSMMLT